MYRSSGRRAVKPVAPIYSPVPYKLQNYRNPAATKTHTGVSRTDSTCQQPTWTYRMLNVLRSTDLTLLVVKTDACV